jgi:hypothetical protein
MRRSKLAPEFARKLDELKSAKGYGRRKARPMATAFLIAPAKYRSSRSAGRGPGLTGIVPKQTSPQRALPLFPRMKGLGAGSSKGLIRNGTTHYIFEVADRNRLLQNN